jgi:uncharacterized Zn finger protein (UPF0148 family)
MSDFDKEAERQKLREKYDHDREKRKETERMSQLLLQGATMTNRHCGTCGDPLFRYEGNEFCATCEGNAEETATGEGATADADTGEPTAAAATDGAADSATPDDVDGDAAGHPSPTRLTGGEGTERDASDGSGAATPGAGGAPSDASGPTADSTPAVSVDAPTTNTHDEGDGDLDTARAALVRTLTAHARQAEAADGPRRATDHLTAVREAAEALSALDGIRR